MADELMRQVIRSRRGKSMGDHFLQEGSGDHMDVHHGDPHHDAGPKGPMSHSKSIEHESEDKQDELPESPTMVKSNTKHQNKDYHVATLKGPTPKHVVSATDHESLDAVSRDDDDSDDDVTMAKHFTNNMTDHDMEQSVSRKPRSLGERVRQHAVVKMSKNGKY